MQYRRMAIERESPEQLGYDRIQYNLSESSYIDQRLSATQLPADGLLLCYGDHLGDPQLRQAIATDYGMQPHQILVTAGAASALFMVATALLQANDSLLVMVPNYATNIETPRTIGCNIHYLPLDIAQQYRLDMDMLRSMVQQHRPKLISLTTPHNPTGRMMSIAELQAVAHIAEQYDCYVLVDETYRDLCLLDEIPPAAATLSARMITISSVSKAYGLPGIRIGWLACQNAALMETLLAAKEQIFICNSVIDEAIAAQTLLNKHQLLPPIMAQVRRRLQLLTHWLQNETLIDYQLPDGGVVCFVRVNVPIDTTRFYKILFEEYGTYVGAGHWFDMPAHYMRIGFGWQTHDQQLQAGLEAISHALRQCRL